MKIGVVGLGLIGGSMAKALKKNPDNVILGFDASNATLEMARLFESIDDELTDKNIGECDVIIVALYPRETIEYIKDKAPLINKEAIVIDCCGTKRMVCEECFPIAEEYGFTFIGGHPMAGIHHSGFKYSSEDMFRGASMVIVPPVYDDILLLEHLKNIFKPCGFAAFTVSDPEKHDKLIAFTSQMAHVVSNAFIKSPSAPQHSGISAGSYKDLTRVAWLNPKMWAALFLENKDNMLFELNYYINSLIEYRDAIEAEDFNRLEALLEDGRQKKKEVDG